MLLEGIAGETADGSGPQIAREALMRYGEALGVDPLSVTAATGLARLSTRLADAYGAVAAATSLADPATQPKAARPLSLRRRRAAPRRGRRPAPSARGATGDPGPGRSSRGPSTPTPTPPLQRAAWPRSGWKTAKGERLIATFQISLTRAPLA